MIEDYRNESDIEFEITTETQEDLPDDIPYAATEVVPEAPLPRKKIYQLKWFWIVIAALLVVGMFGVNKDDDKSAVDDSSAVAEEQAREIEEQVQEQEEAAEETQGGEVALSDEFIVSFLNSSDEWSGSWKIQGEHFYVFYPEGDLAEAFELLGNYYKETGEIYPDIKEPFDAMVDGMRSLSASISDVIGEPCALAVANPVNTDNVILTFMSGVVIYNAFEE